jgi:hypothetical protein
MIKKIQRHKTAFFLAILLFLIIYCYYSVVDPLIPLNGDDWRYFSSFTSHPLPKLGLWNVTRIFQEHLMPVTGYISSFVIYPLVDDYFVSASITLAVMIAIFIVAFFLASYRLFIVLCEKKGIAIFVAVMTMAICFAIFKENPADNVHMFFVHEYHMYYYYVFPNILNSIVVFELMRKIVLEKSLLLSPDFKSGWLIVAIYFSIFSMLFSSGIILVFTGVILIYRFFSAYQVKEKLSSRLRIFSTECVKQYNLAIIIISGIIIAMLLELTSIRSQVFESVSGSSLMTRISDSAYNIFLHARSINKYILVIMLLVFIIACFMYFKGKKEDRSNPIFLLAVKCLISIPILLIFHILLATRSLPRYVSEIRCAYGAYFFGILCISLLSIYILQELKYSRIVFPLVLMVILMVMVNSNWPYQNLAEENKESYVHQLVPAILEADEAGHTDITIYIPLGSAIEDWAIECLAEMLYYHKMTFYNINVKKGIIENSPDNLVYYVPNP